MTEDERVKQINNAASVYLQDWLEKLENEEVTQDDLLASLYGSMVAAYLLGYSPDTMVGDAKAGAERLMLLLKETEESLSETKTCKNKDEDGGCPLHNLHCQYPDCEK
jgi:hypothetical protein